MLESKKQGIPWTDVILVLGSNMGDRIANCEKACFLLADALGPIARKSAFYGSEPWGYQEQAEFVNQAVLIKSSILDPEIILSITQRIERKLGRVPSVRWGPRLIDIDIIDIGGQVIRLGEKLQVPHPYVHKRNFCLLPMQEICPEYTHPILKKRISDLISLSLDDKKVFPIKIAG